MDRKRFVETHDWLSAHADGGVLGITASDVPSELIPEMKAQDRQVRTVDGYHVDTDELEPIYTRTLDSSNSEPVFETVYRTDKDDTFVLYRRRFCRDQRTLGDVCVRLLQAQARQSDGLGHALCLVGFLFFGSALGGNGSILIQGKPGLIPGLLVLFLGGSFIVGGIGIEYAATPAGDCQELAVVHGEEKLRSRVNERGYKEKLPERFRPEDLSVEATSTHDGKVD